MAPFLFTLISPIREKNKYYYEEITKTEYRIICEKENIMKQRKNKIRRANLEMVTRIDAEGYVMSVEFIRQDGSSDKLVIDREEEKEDEKED